MIDANQREFDRDRLTEIVQGKPLSMVPIAGTAFATRSIAHHVNEHSFLYTNKYIE